MTRVIIKNTMLAWKRNGILVILVIWICTFIIGRNLKENSLHFKPPKPSPYYEGQDVTINTNKKYNASSKWEDGLKTILFYTPFFHMIDFQFGFGQQPFIDYGCPVTNCYTTNDPNIVGKFLQITVLMSKSFKVKKVKLSKKL